jgi:hypothetical protein
MRMSTPNRETPNLTSRGQLDKYNYEHFWHKQLFADFWKTLRGEGMQPGSEAPDFELETTEGDRVRLSELRGQPVVLRFGSFT